MKRVGFTLIELAIVITIIGIILAGGTQIMKLRKEKALTQIAQEDVKVAKEAVIGNAIINNGTLPDDDFFQANLSPEKTNQHPLLYVHDSALEDTSACGFSTTSLKVEIEKKDGSTQTVENVAFIIVAEGANRNLQTALDSANNKVKLYHAAKTVDDEPNPVDKDEPYDDIAQWVTLKELQSELRCQDKEFRFITDSLPSAEEGDTSYDGSLYVENNLSDVSISCSLCSSSDHNLMFVDPSFSVKPAMSLTKGQACFDCTASEDDTPNRSITKRYIININDDPEDGDGSGGGILPGL